MNRNTNDLKSNPTDHKRPPISVLVITENKHVSLPSLCDTIAEQLGAKVKISSAKLATSNNAQLLLLDASSLDFESMYDLLRQSTQSSIIPKCAIFNLPPTYPLIRKLAEWPQVYGLFYKQTAPQELTLSLGEILNDQVKLPREIINQLITKLRKPPRQNQITPQQDNLSLREKQILVRLKEGFSNAEIAKMLFVSEHTIKSHLYSAYRKLKIKTRLEASNWAMDNLVDFPLVDPRTQKK